MPTEQLSMSNDPYSSERAVLSIPDMQIKQEQSDSKNTDIMIMKEIERLANSHPEYAINSDELISPEDMCMSPMDPEQNLMSDFNKMPVEMAGPCKNETMKSEKSHFVKYVLKDGKHMKIWECGICSKEFGHQYTLMRHLPTHTDERKFRCNTCGKAFRQMSTLSQHRAIHSAERPYICEICRKTFNRVSTLISHRKTHTGHKPHRCHLCNKAFHQKGNLRNHVFTHTNARPYKCDVCGKGFNQMSNLMCHKLKAHQRADKPRYNCQVCGKDFPKRMALRNHEQYQHGVTAIGDDLQLPEPPTLEQCPSVDGNTPARVRYTNGVLVEPINTDAMKLALKTNQTPFALLRPLNGIPVLVRVLAAGDKQMLVPATAEDLRRHGQITITATPNSTSEVAPPPLATTDSSGNGSTVQIKIPVVATVVQRCSTDGSLCMAVQSPGPKESTTDGFVIASAEDCIEHIDGEPTTTENTVISFNQNQITNHEIQFIDESGNLISENEYNSKNPSIQFDTTEFNVLSGSDKFVGQTIDLDHIGQMAPNANLVLPENLNDHQFSQTGHLQSLEPVSSTVFEVQNAIDAIDNMNELQSGMILDGHGEGDSITMYSDTNNILYESDTQFIL